MNLSNIFFIALKALFVNKVRSVLTMLGVIIGVGSVVLLTSIGTGLQAYVAGQFNDLGGNTLFIVPGKPFGEGSSPGSPDSIVERTKPVLRRSDFNAIMRNQKEFVSAGSASGLGRSEVKYRNITKRITLYGVTPDFYLVTNSPTTVGKWFEAADEARSRRVVTLGSKIATELFGEVDPVGKTIKIDSKVYSILGVVEEKGSGFGGPSFDEYIYLPLATLQDDFNVSLISTFNFKVRDEVSLSEAKSAVRKTMEKSLKPDEFTVFDQTQLLETINNVLGVLTMGLSGIAAISLVVGGIGIMNIMLVSVTERTREIGLRKALGATPSVILIQFLIEAALLSGLGGMIGVGLAYLGTFLIQRFFPAQILPESVLIAFGVSTAVGLVFGAAPAHRASRLSPIEALRSE